MANVLAKKYTVRTITSSCVSAKKYFQNASWKEKWFPVVDAVECYLACDPSGLHVGELNGIPISIASIFKFDENYRTAGCYVVDRAYRGEGYGLKIINEALKRSAPIDILSLYSVPDMASKYERFFGCEQRWLVEMHMIDVKKALTKLDDAPSLMSSIKRLDEVNLQSVCNYDAAIFGYRRDKFIERWMQGSYTRVAVDAHENIVGFAVAKPLYHQENCYWIGPLFCGSLEIAKSLLKAIFDEINELELSAEQKVISEFAVGVNPYAKELTKILGGNVLDSTVFMSTTNKPLPKSDFKKWYSVTHTDIA